MKIGFVFDDSLDKTDGVQQYILSLGSWLTTQGHEVHYLVGQTKRQDLAQVHSLSRNISVQFNGNHMSVPLPASGRRLRQLLLSEQFDVLHVQMPYSPLLAGKIIRRAPPKTAVIGTFHIAPYSRLVTAATHLLAWWSRPSLKRFNRVVSVSPAAQAFAHSTYGLQTEIVPNVFDYQHFATARPLPQYDDDVTTILFFGRLVARKGCQTLLQAVAELNKTKQSFRVVIAGDGPLRSELEQYVHQQNLSDSVTFAGRISETDKPRYFASADIAVFPSSGGESFGIVLLEAMARGSAAVLGGDNPGYRSVLGEYPELLFPARDYRGLSKKLHEYMANTQVRTAAADWATQAARQYDVNLVGAHLLALYHEVIAQNSNKAA